MNIKSILCITISSMSLLLNNGIASNLDLNEIDESADNISVNSEQIELIPNQNNHNNNNNNNIGVDLQNKVLIINNHNNINEIENDRINIKEVVKDNKETFCDYFKKICNGIVVVPISLCSYVISILEFDIPEETRNNLHKASTAIIKPAFDNMIVSLQDCITTSCNKLITFGTNVLGGVKGYIVRKIWG